MNIEKTEGILSKNSSSARPQTGVRRNARQKNINIMTEDELIDSLPLKTTKSVRNGMQKPSLGRHGIESLGMVSFNMTRNMYPTRLDHDKEVDPMFRQYPHLKEFKCDEAKLEKMRNKDASQTTK